MVVLSFPRLFIPAPVLEWAHPSSLDPYLTVGCPHLPRVSNHSTFEVSFHRQAPKRTTQVQCPTSRFQCWVWQERLTVHPSPRPSPSIRCHDGHLRSQLRSILSSCLSLLHFALFWQKQALPPTQAPIWTSRESLIRVVVLDLIRTLMIIKPG